MDKIFHEKQEGYLCAQHCLNALLQGSYFNAVDLANLACQMDEEERLRMAESGVDSEEYQRFLEQPSENMDDSGYFSVQVISSALKVWELELIPYNSTEPTALIAQKNPSDMNAYICNYKGHWFTIRKLGKQWFNLNSMLSGPQLISDTYLAIYLAQLIQEGYSIFIIVGSLPPCEVNDILTINPIVPEQQKSKSDSFSLPSTSKGHRLGTRAEHEASLQQQQTQKQQSSQQSQQRRPESTHTPRERIIPIITIDDAGCEDDENSELQKALQLSLEESYRDEFERKNEEALQLRLDMNAIESIAAQDSDEEDEEEQLRKALQMSLECVTTPSSPNSDSATQVHWTQVRLPYLSSYAKTPGSEEPPKLNL